MISNLICLVNRQLAVNPVCFGGPWISTPQRKRPDGPPRGSFPHGPSLSVGHARFPRYSGSSEPHTNLPTLLTMTLRLDSSFEATTP